MIFPCSWNRYDFQWFYKSYGNPDFTVYPVDSAQNHYPNQRFEILQDFAPRCLIYLPFTRGNALKIWMSVHHEALSYVHVWYFLSILNSQHCRQRACHKHGLYADRNTQGNTYVSVRCAVCSSPWMTFGIRCYGVEPTFSARRTVTLLRCVVGHLW